MGKYLVVAPNFKEVIISDGYSSKRFEHGTFMYDDSLAVNFSSVFQPVEETTLEKIIEPFIDVKDEIVEIAKDTAEFAGKLVEDIKEGAVETKDEIVEAATDIAESAKKSYSRKGKKIEETVE